MDSSKLCRTCGKLTVDAVDIFHTEGLRAQIETCLPITVSPHSLLPDTICNDCYGTILSFYTFIKNCLQSIVILESKFSVTESCFKRSDRPHDFDLYDQRRQSQDSRNELNEARDKINSFAKKLADIEKNLSTPTPLLSLVAYELSSDEDPELPKTKNYFDDKENDFIREITERKSLKRKSESILQSRTKIFKSDVNRRKRRPPVRRIEERKPTNLDMLERIYDQIGEVKVSPIKEVPLREEVSLLPQVCLLCDGQFTGPAQLQTHVYEVHGIDMAQVASSEPVPEKRKKIPNLVKIADLKHKRESQESNASMENCEEPPTLEPSYVCPLCPASFTNKNDLFFHLRQKHASKSHLLCGLCLYIADSYLSLTAHLETCSTRHTITNPYVCKVCKYNEENQKTLENHVLVHDFIITFCRKEGKIFDPSDYVEVNETSESLKSFACGECQVLCGSFKEFSAHRRSEHSIFHCDLCNKYYGRNSHLWKHVNRLHKGHPSITCQYCYKTSASKYHLAQHFNKIHTMKTKIKNGDADEEDFMNKKFEAFDFQNVRQSFMRQEMLNNVKEERDGEVPKEIDTSSKIYTNIITNYTPPQNSGEFKCPKCTKGFHKKTLLKKHKKNCRPRLQKDLLTRCKSCSRIFKDRQSLAKHLVNYHSEYNCEICDEKVASKCEIVSHIRFNHPDCHLSCTDCGNVLRNKEDFQSHSLDHANSFVCQFCGDLLPSKIKLKMHILSLHRKILSLSCGICLKLFETQHVLRDHVRLVHKDVLTPITSCTVCGKNYGSKWKTFDHLNKSHGRIFKACKACLEVFDNEKDLQAHYDEAHANVKEKIVKKEVISKKEFEESEPEIEKNTTSAEESAYEMEDSKMSLLEQRLTSLPAFPSMQQMLLPARPQLEIKTVAAKKTKKVRSEYVDQNGTNTTKRTVYVNSNDPSLCEICLKSWPAKKHLWQHYIRCHKSVAATVCGICLKTNSTYEDLQNHLRVNHPKLLHGQGYGSNFICRICGRYHNASSKLKLHMAIHENFDWKLLDDEEVNEHDGNITNNTPTHDENINYESLIEQVECSSDESSSSSESEDSDEEEEEEESNETTTETQDPVKVDLKLEESEEDESSRNSVEVKSENTSDDDEEEEEEEGEDVDEEEEEEEEEEEVVEELDAGSDKSESEEAKTMNIYRRADVVDSAVKSICFEDEECDAEDSDQDFCEVQTHNLNIHEIQSAVDSIL